MIAAAAARTRAAITREDLLAVLASAPAGALLAWWVFSEGGYPPTSWYPGAVALVATAAMTAALRAGGLRALPRPVVVSIGAFAGYTAWSYLSILWAPSPGLALEGSHRTLLFFAAFAGAAILPWRSRSLAAVLHAWIALVAAAAVVTLLRLGGDEALAQVGAGRLIEPLGYQNANAALWTMAALPAWMMAARRQTPLALRPLLLAAAALLLCLSVLSQSRGWLFTLPVVVLLAVVLVPQRLRLLLHAIPVVAAVALATPSLLEPYGASGFDDPPALLEHALNEAAAAAWRSTLVALVLAAILVAADRLVPIAARTVGRASRGVAAVALLAALAGGAIGWAATDGRPAERIEKAWNDFTSTERPDESAGSHLAELHSGRYDFWRVSVDLWSSRPLLGVGQDNFAAQYLPRRRTEEEPRWIHSLVLRLLAHTGLVGALLFGVAIAGALWAAAGARDRPADARWVTAAATVPVLDWGLHGSVDWMWEYPALTVPALGLLAMAAVAAHPGAGRLAATRGGGRRRVAVAAGMAVAAVAAVSLALGWVAARDVELASANWRADPQLALARLDQAASLNPLDARAPLVEGLIETQLDRPRRAEAALREAVRRDSADWIGWFELGLVAGNPNARQDLMAALRRNPQEPLIREALRRLGTPKPLTPLEAARSFRERTQRRLARPGE